MHADTKCERDQHDHPQSSLVRNHPSGDTKPSRDDIEMTREIGTSAGALGIAIHDHLVIGRKGHASFRSLGLLIPSAMPSIADAEHEDNGVEVVVRWPELT